MKMKLKTTRRTFLQTTGVVAASAFAAPAFLHAAAANSKLNVALVGVSGMRGGSHLGAIHGENVVALCDVNKNFLDKVGDSVKSADRFVDFRQLLEKHGDKLDAIVVSTPDHTHAAVSVAAMKLGIHCYVEKPMAHDVNEIRVMQKIAKDKNLKTQQGTQIHEGENYRRVVEHIQAGVIGTVKTVHVWTGAGWGNKPRPTGTHPIPPELDWDLWLGPVPETPFNPTYLGGNWRSYWLFGSGPLGDFGCHYGDLPFWALGLEYPTSIEATGPEPDPVCCKLDLTIKYEFPKTDKHDALTYYWYDHTAKPALYKDFPMPKNYNGGGVLFVGTEGVLLANYTEFKIYGEEAFFKTLKHPEPSIPKSLGHHNEWLNAIKNGGDTTCNFDYAGRLTETVLLGGVAFRVGKKIAWNAAEMKTDNKDANKLLSDPRRNGWEL
ncbi:MAG: Gfo/Idh/MocA family oxidoreductase [Planctomycetaceae bacterium]|nr:Gfo/Idh/MocA family oxidoreductase [Planctomycetaceae bacterium]